MMKNRKKRRTALAVILSLCLIMNGAQVTMSSAAENESGAGDGAVTDVIAPETASEADTQEVLADENRNREYTVMDENGNITEAEPADGTVPEQNSSNSVTLFRSRAATSTAKVVNFNTKGNAVTNYTDAATGEAGYTNGAYGADAAYLGTSGSKVKFMMSGVIGYVDASDVQVISLSQAKVVSGYYVSGGRLIHGIVCDMTTPGYRTTLDNGAAPSYLKSGVTYYSYDGHYFYTDYATMLSDYQSNVRTNSVNPDDPYYNYYQYLPMRSTTSYSSSTFSSIINSKASASSKMYGTGSTFISNQNTYGVNALIMAGIAANESAWGTSWIAANKNNLFGLNAVDSSPGTSSSTYGSVSSCISDFANGWMSRGYLDPDDWRYCGGFLGNKESGLNVKYASDPYWGEKAANIAYALDKTQGSKDYNKYTIGIKDTVETSVLNDIHYVNVRNTATTASSSTVLYNTGGSTSYSVIILSSSKDNGFYKIQSDGVLNSSRTSIASGTGNYSFSSMYAYIYSDYVEPVNDGTAAVTKTLSSIEITKPPSKTEYTEGDTFSKTGMTVTAKYSDGSTVDVTSKVTISPSGALKTSDKSVTVTYTENSVTKTASQAIAVKAKPVVTSVSINPKNITLKQGESQKFSFRVEGENNPSADVTWTVSGAVSKDTVIDDTGMLKIADDESSETLTVRVTSVYDEDKYAEATVAVEKTETEKPGSEMTDPDDSEDQDQSSGTDAEDKETTISIENGSDEATKIAGIAVSAVFGEGARLDVIEITEDKLTEENSSISYDEMLAPAAGMDEVLGVYEISVDGTYEGDLKLTFTVDEKYEGWDALVLHYVEEDKNETDAGSDPQVFCEKYDTEVENGKITVTVDSLSPFILGVSDPGKPESGTTGDGASGGGTTEKEPPANGGNEGNGENNGNAGNSDGNTVQPSQPENGDSTGKPPVKEDGSDSREYLDTLIKYAEELDYSRFTEDTADAAKNALEKAKAVLADNAATGEELDAASTDLYNALTALAQTDTVKDTSSKTGDEFEMSIWLLSATAAALAIVAVLLGRKPKRRHS